MEPESEQNWFNPEKEAPPAQAVQPQPVQPQPAQPQPAQPQPVQPQPTYVSTPAQQVASGQPVVMSGQPMVMGGQPVVMGGQTVMGGYPATSATTAFVLSIVSIFIGGVCLAIPALIIANGALTITNQYPGHPDAGSAKAAKVISWIIIGLTLLVVGLILLLIIVGAATGTA